MKGTSQQYDRELAESLNRQMTTDKTPALPDLGPLGVAFARQARADTTLPVTEAESPWSSDGSCPITTKAGRRVEGWLRSVGFDEGETHEGILAIEAEAAQTRDDAHAAGVRLGLAHAAQARDGEAIALLRSLKDEAHKGHSFTDGSCLFDVCRTIDTFLAARALIEKGTE